MMKYLYLYIITIFLFKIQNVQAQSVGINTTEPDASAILDIVSNNRGVLIPRLTAVERDSLDNIPLGLTIYCTTSNCLNVYNGSKWKQLCSDAPAAMPPAAPQNSYKFAATDVEENEISLIIMEVAPNPVSDKLNIKAILSQQQTQMMVQINDLNGKLMSLQSIKNLQSGEHLLTVNTKNWQNGLYVLTLYNEHFSKSTQIFIQH